MPKFFIQASQMQDDKITLIGEDVKHIECFEKTDWRRNKHLQYCYV